MYDVQSIIDRIAGYLINETSRLEGSWTMDNIQAVAQEMAMMYYMTILPIDDKYFLDTASLEWLDRRALDFNETRNPAKNALGTVTFKGTPGTLIPSGTGVQTEVLTFETTEDAVILDTNYIKVPVVCLTAGTVGNIAPAEIISVRPSDGLSGVEVTNQNAFAGGADEESDEAFRLRILEKIRRPYTSGNCNDYVRWAKQVSGVGNAICIPCWDGNGTVKVIVLSAEGGMPDDVILQNVIDHIENNRPIGASVTVVKAIPKDIVISARIKMEYGFTVDLISEEFRKQMQEYLTDKAFGTDKTLSYFKVSDLMYNVAGVADVIDYTINDHKASISADPEEFYRLQEVTINVA